MSITLEDFIGAKERVAREIIDWHTKTGRLKMLKTDGFTIEMFGRNSTTIHSERRSDGPADHEFELETWTWDELMEGGADWFKGNVPFAHLILQVRSIRSASEKKLSHIFEALTCGSIGSVHQGAWHINAIFPTEWHARQSAFLCSLIFGHASIAINDDCYEPPTRMITTDGLGRAWCLRCALDVFAGIRGENCTEPNAETFTKNVKAGCEDNGRGGALQVAAQEVINYVGRCEKCHERLVK